MAANLKPRHLEDFPEFVEAHARWSDLKAELSGLNREIQGIHTRLGQPSRESQRLDAEARLLLGDKEVAVADDPHETLADLEHRREVTRLACDMASKSRKEARVEASKAICESLRPTFVKQLKRMAEATRKLLAVQQEHRQLINDLEHESIIVGDPICRASLPNAESTEYLLESWLAEFGDRAKKGR